MMLEYRPNTAKVEYTNIVMGLLSGSSGYHYGESDLAKLNALAVMGWHVIDVTSIGDTSKIVYTLERELK
jgi:hypothetical protein